VCKTTGEMNRDLFPHVYFTTSEKVAQKLNVTSMGEIGILQPEKFWSKFEPKMIIIDEVGVVISVLFITHFFKWIF